VGEDGQREEKGKGKGMKGDAGKQRGEERRGNGREEK